MSNFSSFTLLKAIDPPDVESRRGETPSPVAGEVAGRGTGEVTGRRWTNTLFDVLCGDLEKIYSSENHVARALPPVAKAAADHVLKYALAQYLAQIESHRQRLNIINGLLGLTPQPQALLDMEAFIVGSDEMIRENHPGSVRDFGLTCAVLKMQDFQIISYGCVHNLAVILGLKEAAKLLEATLGDKFAANARLRDLAEVINFRIGD